MSKYFIGIFLLIVAITVMAQSVSLAQTIPQSVRVKISYENSGQYLEQAIGTIEAANKIGETATVDYNAGHSVTLFPGFEARNGSVFTANIKPIITRNELSLQLKVYPNPFDQSTIIDYDLPEEGKVNIWITDAQGKIIHQLIKDENQSAGKHQAEWRADGTTPGVYIPVIEANKQKVVGRIVKR